MQEQEILRKGAIEERKMSSNVLKGAKCANSKSNKGKIRFCSSEEQQNPKICKA